MITSCFYYVVLINENEKRQNIRQNIFIHLSINNPFLKSLSNGIGARFSSVSNKRRNASRAAISSASEIVAPAPKNSFINFH